MAKKPPPKKRQEPAITLDASRALKNPKHEKLCHIHAAGEPAYRAYEMAGFKGGKSAHEQVRRLLSKPEIRARLEYLVAQLAAAATESAKAAIKSVAIDKEWVMRNLKEVVERCMQSVPVRDMQGKQVMIETPDGETAAAFTFNAKGAIGALVPLGKELGMFVDRKEIRHGKLEDMSEEQLDAFIKQCAGELGVAASDTSGKLH